MKVYVGMDLHATNAYPRAFLKGEDYGLKSSQFVE